MRSEAPVDYLSDSRPQGVVPCGRTVQRSIKGENYFGPHGGATGRTPRGTSHVYGRGTQGESVHVGYRRHKVSGRRGWGPSH